MSEVVKRKVAVEVAEPYWPTKDKILHYAGLAIGVIGVLLTISIIFIIAGLTMIVIGGGRAWRFNGRTTANCPVCETENLVIRTTKKMKCEGCDEVSPIKWV